MQFTETPLKGAFLIDLEKKEDERGFFARVFCTKEFEQLNLKSHFVQVNNSFSQKRGTLRGIHYQLPPKGEIKLVRCIQGALYDLIIDLRSFSPTYLQWFGVELNSENRQMIYVPEGFGHAFLTLKDNTEALYMVSEFYAPEYERGLRYDDPLFQIKWPLKPVVISNKDLNHPPFNTSYHSMNLSQ